MVATPLSLSASMTRWKPSVSSCSPTVSVLCAVVGMLLPPLRFFSCAASAVRFAAPSPSDGLRPRSHPKAPITVSPPTWATFPAQSLLFFFCVACRSVERNVALDVVAQSQRVLAHETLRAVGIARLEGGHDLLVIDDRPLGAVLLEDGALPD